MSYSDIKKLREEFKLSQSKLAKLSGISPYKISAFELEKEIPSAFEINQLFLTLNNVKKSIINNQFSLKKRFVKDESLERNLPISAKTKNEYLAKNSFSGNKTEYVDILDSLLENAYQSPLQKRLRGLALFSGCGGITLGFESAGFDILGHVEIDVAANRIYAENFPHSKLLGEDICGITDAQIQEWKEKYGELDVIIGGPPCQGFSLAGKRDPLDERNQLYRYHANIVKIMRPKTFIMENVGQMVSLKDKNGELFFNSIISTFTEIGYNTYYKILNVVDYGVPQDRIRIVIVGIRKDVDINGFDFKPDKTITYRTFRDATCDLVSLESGEQSEIDSLHWAISHPKHIIEMLSIVPEGRSAHENEDKKMRPTSGFNTTYKRICWNEPCSTIGTNFSIISGCRTVHPTNTRSLTIREACRAQSFPDKFAFVGKWGDIRRAIGNAVPPLFAKIIAEMIIRQILLYD